MYIHSNPSQPIDREQVQQQLAALGYKAGDRVYLRAFFPGSDPRKANDAGRKAEANSTDQLIETATKFQAKGRGVYIVVNGGGHTDKDVQQTRAIFYEHDNLDKATQTNLWKGLGLPEPTLQIDTGGKSIHSYWVFEEPATVADWKLIQTDLLEFADADRALKNPSRVMRLAGAWHSSGKQSLIISNSGKRYSYADLRETIPLPQKAEPTLFQAKQPLNNLETSATVPEKYEDIELPVPANVPLDICLAKASRDLLNGVSEGGRNVAGHQLACDLIGTANYLQSIGQRFDGDADSLFQDFGNRCSPALSVGEMTSIWKSAQSSNPSPACKSEGVENCIRGYYWNSIRPIRSNAGKVQTSQVLTHPNFRAQPLDALLAEIDVLINSDLKRSALKLEILKLSEKYRRAEKEIWSLYKTREEEQEQADNQEDTAAEVARLLSAQKSGLELAEILPPGLATPLKELAGRLNLKPECYLAACVGQVSSLFKVGTETLLRRDTDYRCTPNYFIVNVSESSNKKTPVKKGVIDRPMQALREKARREYEKAIAEYEEEYRQWKAAGKDKGLPPKEPRQRLYSFSKSTGEGILYQVAAFPDQALMYSCDELAGLFKSANQYRGGKGSDEEDLLEFWNGTGSTVLRASGTKADVDGLLLSIFGTIQPDVLAELLKDCSDSNGKFARFDFVFQPLAASKLSEEDGGSFDITPMLAALYTAIDKLPVMKFELNPEAKRLFTAFYNATEERRINEPKQGMRAMVGKMPEKVGKMATILHTLHCAFTGGQVSLQIPRSAVEAAIKFVKFSADQIASLYAEFSDRKALAPNLAKLVLLAERKGGTLSTREAQLAFPFKHRPSAQEIREWFGELESMKFGELTTVKKTISFSLTTTTVTTVTSNVDTERLKSDYSTDSTLTTVTTVNGTTVVNCGHTVVKGRLQSESLSDKDSEPTVVTVVTNSASSKKSENLLLSSDHPQSLKSAAIPKGHKTFELGQRVVVKDVGGIYQGVRGEIVDTLYGRAGATYLIKFDKPVRNIRQSEFEGSDLMKL